MQDLRGESFFVVGISERRGVFIGRGEVVIEERIGFHRGRRERQFLRSRNKDECSLTRW